MTRTEERTISCWRASAVIDLPSLGFFRILFGLFTMLFAWPEYAWIGTVPDSLFSPHMFSLAGFMNGFPSERFFIVLDTIIALSTITLTVGLFTRFSTLCLLLGMIVGNSFMFSFGKIDHSCLYLCVLFVMVFLNWGQYVSLDSVLRAFRQHESESSVQGHGTYDLTLLAVLVAFGFFTAGFGKALAWIDFDTTQNGFMSWFYYGYFNLNRQFLLAPFVARMRPTWVWECADIAAVVFELGFFVAFFRRRLWFAWLTMAACFHLVNTLILNIPFLVQSLVYLCFLPWIALFPGLKKIIQKPGLFLSIVTSICLISGVFRLFNSASSQGIFFLLTGSSPQDELFYVVSAVIWMLVGSLLFWYTSRMRTFSEDPTMAM